MAALVSVCFTAFYEWPELTHRYYVDDDIRPAFLVWRYRDPSLFPNDPSSVLYRPFGPRGFLWFYGAIATRFDWLAASKFVPFFTMGISSLLVFALGRRRSAATGWIVLAAFLLLCRTNQFYTSSWRAVANVLVCGFVYAAATRRWVWMLPVFAAGAFVYPVLLAPLTTAGALILLKEWLAGKTPAERATSLKRFAAFAGLVALSAVAVWAVFRSGAPVEPLDYRTLLGEGSIRGRFPFAGLMEVSWANVSRLGFWEMNVFLGGGAQPEGSALYLVLLVLTVPAAVWIRRLASGGHRTRSNVLRSALLSAVSVLFAAGIWGGHLSPLPGGFYWALWMLVLVKLSAVDLDLGIPEEMFWLVLAAAGCGTAIFLLGPWISIRLYFGTHQVRHIVPLLSVIAAGYALASLRENRLVLLPAVLPLFLLAVPAAAAIARDKPDYAVCDAAPLYEYLRQTGKAAIVIGHPMSTDCAAVFGQRSPLVTMELTWPVYRQYWDLALENTRVTFDALFAGSVAELAPVCERYPEGLVVFESRYYPDNLASGPPPYFYPFDEQIRRLASRGPLVANDFPPELKVFEWPGGFVASCDRIRHYVPEGTEPHESARP